MIVKLDGLILKLKIVVSLIFSVLSLWILFPELIRGSLREDLVKQFPWSHCFILALIIHCSSHRWYCKSQRSWKTVGTWWQFFNLLRPSIWTQNLWNSLIRDWVCQEGLVNADGGYWTLFDGEIFFEMHRACLWLDAEVDDKKRYQVLLIFFKNGEIAITYDKNLVINHGRNVPMSQRCEWLRFHLQVGRFSPIKR